jgi:hypothetical protein
MGQDEVPELPLCGGMRGLTCFRGHDGGYAGCIEQGYDLIIKSCRLRIVVER